MFVNNINPVLFKLGVFEIRYYGIIYALGFIITYFFLRYYIKKDKLKNVTLKQLDDLIMYLLLGVVLGARLFHFVFYNPSVFFTDFLEIFRVWNGGLSFHGGLIGATFAMYLFSRKNKVKLMQLLDAGVVPVILALALGRIANFTNSELVGYASNLPWCVQFLRFDNVCRHPYQLYASLSHFILFFVLLYVYKNQKKEGTNFWTFVMLYGGFRFIADFFRMDPRLFGISMGQFLSLIMFIAGGIILLRRLKSSN